MRVWVLACLMAITAMAGCVEDNEPETADVDSCEGSDCPDDQIMMGANPGASLVANATEGEAPSTVFFEFDVYEVPLEMVTWTLDVNGDGELETEGPGLALPGNFSYTYDAADVYEALFFATDGTNNWTSMVAINITEPVADEPEPVDEPPAEEPAAPAFPVVIRGELEASNPDFYTGAQVGPHFFCSGWSDTSDIVGGACAWFEILPEWLGRSFTTSGAGDIDVWIGDACESNTAMSTHVGGATGHDTGTIPEGSTCFALANYESDGAWTVTIS